jgi:DNA-binding transcriptional ArsR family regulator
MPALRFGWDDLAHTRVATEPSVTAEVAYSLRMLDEPPARCFAGWRRHLRGRLDPRMLSLVHESSTVDGGVALSEDDRLEVLSRYRQVAIAPFWERIQLLIDADRRRRARVLLDGGLAALLITLHPALTWRTSPRDGGGPAVLRIPEAAAGPGRTGPLDLSGRGLVLQPSVFVWRAPVLWHDPTGQPVLLYGVSCELTASSGDGKELAALVGRARATLLTTLDRGAATTTELARAAGLSLAATSQHTGVLRGAGLICTQRAGKCRLHALTPLGVAILAGTATPSDAAPTTVRP